ncbi:MAG: hypothetical protein LLG21_05160 [Euryarchaeota archaeon]|nr:hypothetical protein [Euryarchaeota archaeon]HQM66353.1 hypothetical protein [Methanomassiliicoccales archaeon]
MGKASDVTIVALLAIGAMAVAILAIMHLDLLLAAIVVLVLVGLLALAVLLVLGGLAAVPYYFAKRGQDTHPGSYSLEQLKDNRDQGRK